MVQIFSCFCYVRLLSYEGTCFRMRELMCLGRLQNCRITESENREITNVRDCKIAKLRNCKITKLQTYKVLTITLTKGISQQPQRVGIGSSHILPQTSDNQETSKDPLTPGHYTSPQVPKSLLEIQETSTSLCLVLNPTTLVQTSNKQLNTFVLYHQMQIYLSVLLLFNMFF